MKNDCIKHRGNIIGAYKYLRRETYAECARVFVSEPCSVISSPSYYMLTLFQGSLFVYGVIDGKTSLTMCASNFDIRVI